MKIRFKLLATVLTASVCVSTGLAHAQTAQSGAVNQAQPAPLTPSVIGVAGAGQVSHANAALEALQAKEAENMIRRAIIRRNKGDTKGACELASQAYNVVSGGGHLRGSVMEIRDADLKAVMCEAS